MYKFYLNLDRSPERRKKFDETWTRFPAVDGATFNDDEPILERMVSFWNISPKEHRAKCGCYQSHYNLLSHIRNNKLNHVIVAEDDAIQMDSLQDIMSCKNFTYLGGYFSHLKMTEGCLKDIDDFPISAQGVNPLDRTTHRILMTLSYYIPNWRVARDILDFLDSQVRVRAIDVMLHKINTLSFDYMYPAKFIEEPIASTIHTTSRQKHPTIHYQLL